MCFKQISGRALTFLMVWIVPLAACGDEITVTVASDGWNLVGDLNVPASGQQLPVVLMLNGAAGDRRVYADLARHLADAGIASLRIDLPGHGDSTNLGHFVPGERSPNPMIWDAERNISDVVRHLSADERFDAERIAAVGASYSGEEMAEAGRLHAYVAAYVALSPGSFSDESIAGIDQSGVPWLFVTSRDERHLQEIRAKVSGRSETVEQIILPGAEHASRLLEVYPELAERIAVWLAAHL
jgi:dienelactone hydrolase